MGAPTFRAFRRAVLDGRVSAPVSLLIRSALAEAVTVADASAETKNWRSNPKAGGECAPATM